jgi:hypothetical protein
MESSVQLPQHKCSLTIEHNPHRDYYESITDYINRDEDRFDWETPEDRQTAIDTDELWIMQWYPNTPVGFNAVAAPTLEKLLAWALRCDDPGAG